MINSKEKGSKQKDTIEVVPSKLACATSILSVGELVLGKERERIVRWWIEWISPRRLPSKMFQNFVLQSEPQEAKMGEWGLSGRMHHTVAPECASFIEIIAGVVVVIGIGSID